MTVLAKTDSLALCWLDSHLQTQLNKIRYHTQLPPSSGINLLKLVQCMPNPAPVDLLQRLHQAKSTCDWLHHNSIGPFLHPASSPDLNPIEPLWKTLKATSGLGYTLPPTWLSSSLLCKKHGTISRLRTSTATSCTWRTEWKQFWQQMEVVQCINYQVIRLGTQRHS